MEKSSKKIIELWIKVSKAYLNYLCGKTEKTEAAFRRAYGAYKKAGGIKTIQSGENLIKVVN